MQARIIRLKEKKLIGCSIKMNLINNKTAQLWRQFSPRIKEVNNRISEDKISMQVYDANYYQHFSPHNEFEKWATIEVNDWYNIPQGMQPFLLKEGLYAVFDYKGLSSDNSIFKYIFEVWLPNSAYIIDNRPHFEVLGEKYKNNDPESEEEIWIPVKKK